MHEALENAEGLTGAMPFHSHSSETFPAALVEQLCGGSNPTMEYHKYSKLTQVHCQKKWGVSQATIAGIKSGKKNPLPSLMKKL